MFPNLHYKKNKRKEKEKHARYEFSLNSGHLARVPAVLIGWKSTERVHREGTDG